MGFLATRQRQINLRIAPNDRLTRAMGASPHPCAPRVVQYEGHLVPPRAYFCHVDRPAQSLHMP